MARENANLMRTSAAPHPSLCWTSYEPARSTKTPASAPSPTKTKRKPTSSAGTRTFFPSTTVSTNPSSVNLASPCIDGPSGSSSLVALSAWTLGDLGGVTPLAGSSSDDKPPNSADPSSAVIDRLNAGFAPNESDVGVVRASSSKSKSSSAEGRRIDVPPVSKSPKSSSSASVPAGAKDEGVPKLSEPNESEKEVSKPTVTEVEATVGRKSSDAKGLDAEGEEAESAAKGPQSASWTQGRSQSAFRTKERRERTSSLSGEAAQKTCRPADSKRSSKPNFLVPFESERAKSTSPGSKRDPPSQPPASSSSSSSSELPNLSDRSLAMALARYLENCNTRALALGILTARGDAPDLLPLLHLCSRWPSHVLRKLPRPSPVLHLLAPFR
mgnify:FL=1